MTKRTRRLFRVEFNGQEFQFLATLAAALKNQLTVTVLMIYPTKTGCF